MKKVFKEMAQNIPSRRKQNCYNSITLYLISVIRKNVDTKITM